MDFIFGSKETEKTTCLLDIANQFIIDNKIDRYNGYIILFTPPHYEVFDNLNINERNKNNYVFEQHLTSYDPNAKNNMDLIKGYSLSSASYAFGLINNFIELSSKNKGIKLILIDDITNIIKPWVDEEIKKKQIILSKEKKHYDKNIYELLIYNEIFRYFLFQINSLQKLLQIPCIISLNINISGNAHFIKNSPRIFNAIYSFVKNIFYLSKLDDGTIQYNYLELKLNQKTDKIIYKIKEDENNNDNSIINKLFQEYVSKKIINKDLFPNIIFNNEWIRKSISVFVKNINKYQIYQKQIEMNQKEDSSFSQFDN